MSTFFTLITNAGLAKLAYANSLGQGVNWTHMAVGDGNGSAVNPSLTQTALVRERYRAPITNEFYDPTKPLQRNVELVIPANVGGWTAREAGIFDSDGVLVAVCNLPESYKPTLPEGSGKDLGVRMIIEHSNANIINIVVDPSVVLASRQWVETTFMRLDKLAGGTAGQFLRKKSNSQNDFEWAGPGVLIQDRGEDFDLNTASIGEHGRTVNTTGANPASWPAVGVGPKELLFFTYGNATKVYQETTQINAGTEQQRRFWRVRDGGTWSAWREVASVENHGVSNRGVFSTNQTISKVAEIGHTTMDTSGGNLTITLTDSSYQSGDIEEINKCRTANQLDIRVSAGNIIMPDGTIDNTPWIDAGTIGTIKLQKDGANWRVLYF